MNHNRPTRIKTHCATVGEEAAVGLESSPHVEHLLMICVLHDEHAGCLLRTRPPAALDLILGLRREQDLLLSVFDFEH